MRPFPELKIPGHNAAAARLYKTIHPYIRGISERSLRILQIACHKGYFAFNLAMEGHEVTAIEEDPAAFEIAEAIRIFKNVPRLHFHKAHLDGTLPDSFSGRFDLALISNNLVTNKHRPGCGKIQELLQGLSYRVDHLVFRNSPDMRKLLGQCGFHDTALSCASATPEADKEWLICKSATAYAAGELD